MAKAKTIKPKTTRKKTSKASGQAEVVEFMQHLDHPLKALAAVLREIVLSADPKLGEHIKWNAPSFVFNGEDRVTVNLHSREYVALVFHRGAKVRDGRAGAPEFKDPPGSLEWPATDRAVLKMHDLQDVKAKKEQLKKFVSQWVAWSGE
jgi:hypothetical protein